MGYSVVNEQDSSNRESGLTLEEAARKLLRHGGREYELRLENTIYYLYRSITPQQPYNMARCAHYSSRADDPYEAQLEIFRKVIRNTWEWQRCMTDEEADEYLAIEPEDEDEITKQNLLAEFREWDGQDVRDVYPFVAMVCELGDGWFAEKVQEILDQRHIGGYYPTHAAEGYTYWAIDPKGNYIRSRDYGWSSDPRVYDDGIPSDPEVQAEKVNAMFVEFADDLAKIELPTTVEVVGDMVEEQFDLIAGLVLGDFQSDDETWRRLWLDHIRAIDAKCSTVSEEVRARFLSDKRTEEYGQDIVMATNKTILAYDPRFTDSEDSFDVYPVKELFPDLA